MGIIVKIQAPFPDAEYESRVRIDIRFHDDDIAKVCSPRSSKELEQTQGWAMGHMASAMLEKYFGSRPSNTHMVSVLNPIHTKFAPWTLNLWKERSPLQQVH